MLRLFYAPGACSLAPHIALYEAGSEFEAVRLDLKAGDQKKSDYIAVNPKGRVPALVTPRGTLTEVPVILGWIANLFPKAQLKPEGDFFAFSQMQSFNAYLSSTVHVSFAHLIRPERWADSEAARAELKAKTPSNLKLHLELVEEMLDDGRPWVMGGQYTVADPYLYVFARWLEREGAGGAAPFPRLKAHRDRMQQRPAVAAALAAEGIAAL
ncbi:MAG TPA: glutathione S-transferase family protein [Rhizomicrobium sp.]|nr:glutathione S-transferase family protein [Rhizomicrobium sp.]